MKILVGMRANNDEGFLYRDNLKQLQGKDKTVKFQIEEREPSRPPPRKLDDLIYQIKKSN